MDCKIAYVTKELPSPKKFNGAAIYWFHEIEALYAFLLGDSLDIVFLDHSVVADTRSFAPKYQKLISEMHPHIKFEIVKPELLMGTRSSSHHYFPLLKTMFKNGELQNFFQPIVMGTQKDHKIIGYECLTRVRFNNHQFAPDFLFNYAQEKQELTKYDRICLSQALSLAPKIDSLLIFVNVRPQTLTSTNFYPWLKEELKKNNLDPNRVVVEITEQHCTISEYEIEQQCQILKNMGVKIALDDFGSGISNLSLLEITKPDILKISGRFIKGAQNSEIKQKIIKNVHALAQSFAIQAVVENVETEQEWLEVLNLGLSLAQGFYFYRPLDKAGLEKALMKAK
ncbi:MAG: EAL domain-containing protein [Myxococcales bacterium]|nr:EAL domain-containing protein [Myxococcales bacterium]USN49912.1 MAG: EAL domain-containing protein [Myxococcales bacterium]